MDFEVKFRDGPGRISELVIKDKKVITPNILFVDTKRFKAPDFADILIKNNNRQEHKPTLKVQKSLFSTLKNETEGELQVSNYMFYPKDLPKEIHFSAIKLYKKNIEGCYVTPANKDIIDEVLKNNRASIFIVANTSQIFSQQTNFVEFITDFRTKIGYQKIIYLPYIGDPTNLALLTYMGVDFFDSMSAILSARKNFLLLPTGIYNKNDLDEIPCSCPTCHNFHKKPSKMNFQQILNHNYFALMNEMKNVRNAIRQGSLRELVETRIRTNPNLTAILRILDSNYYNFLEERTPSIRKSQLLATTKESLYRPEIKRYQERLIKRYKKPESTKILLLLPCSAKKPYSFSKTHKLFRERLSELKNPHIIHEVIITSPLGVVPRELELTYPASTYDIPVTGIWDEDEKKMIRELLQKYLKINIYDKVIVHLPKAIREFTEDIFKHAVFTCIDHSPTSKKSLDNLSNVLKEESDTYTKIMFSNRKKENVKSLASYQFESKIAESLLKDCEIKGRYPNLRIMYKNKQLGMITQERGLISLTLDGGQIIAKSGKYWVEIYDDFTLKGSVFAPGIKNTDETIRIADEVVVLRNKKLCAVGVAIMNGREMKESLHGEAVKTRHIQ